MLLVHAPAHAQTSSASANGATPQQVQALLDRLTAQDARIQLLESKVQQLSAAISLAANAPEAIPVSQLVATAAPPAALNTNAQPDSQADMGGHSMDLPGAAPR